MNVFICHVPFHYYLFKSTYKHLNNSCFIIPPFSDKAMTTEYGSGMSAKGQYEYVADFLRRKKVEVIDYGERSGRNLSNFLDQNAKNVIINHWFDGIYHLNNVRIIGIMYSLAGLANDDRPVHGIELNFLSDIILTYGTNSANRYNDQGLKAQPIGNTIFDDWFNNVISKDDIKSIEKRLDGDKPTILYLPTHAHFSSIDKYFNSIISLSNDYNIIVKLHHLTFNQEANRLCKLLSNHEFIVLGDYFDPLPLYKFANIVLSDSSGALFDALLLEIPVIMLSVSSQNNGVDLLYNQYKSCSDAKSVIFPSTSIPEELKNLVTENIGKKLQVDDSLKYSLFFKTDGNAGKRAAQIIMNNKRYPAIPVLEKYDRALDRISYPRQRNIIQEMKNDFFQRYYPDRIKEPSLVSRIYRRLFEN